MAQRLRELARAESLPQNERTELAPVIADLRSRFPASSIEASGSLDLMIGMSAEKALIVLSHSRRQCDAAQGWDNQAGGDRRAHDPAADCEQ